MKTADDVLKEIDFIEDRVKDLWHLVEDVKQGVSALLLSEVEGLRNEVISLKKSLYAKTKLGEYLDQKLAESSRDHETQIKEIGSQNERLRQQVADLTGKLVSRDETISRLAKQRDKLTYRVIYFDNALSSMKDEFASWVESHVVFHKDDLKSTTK